jgi:tRNA U34 5-methylaminomethyl-2-thiouridine-forming methyltransferase MnmC
MSNFAQSIQITKDNSPTIFSEQFQQTYHSIHGAIAESNHVFIQHGLNELAKSNTTISIFEMGLGTGLNAALTWQNAQLHNLKINYNAIDLFPVEHVVMEKFKTEDADLNGKLNTLYNLDWDFEFELENFRFRKQNIDLHKYNSSRSVDIIYYDAFAPNAQPELWTEAVFHKLYEFLNPNGILTTYCAKGQVKRNMKVAGFSIMSPPGPIGKREMTVAKKVSSYKFQESS